MQSENVKKSNKMEIPVFKIVIWGGQSMDNFESSYPLNKCI